MNRKLNRKIYVGVFLAIAILLIGPMGMTVVNGQENRTKEEVEVDIDPAERYKNPKTENVGQEDLSNVETNTDVWTQAYGGNDSVPKGVYRGPLLKPSLMELDMKPRYRWKYEDISPESNVIQKTHGNVGSTTLIQKAEFSSNQIMNGASEFFIQVPVTSESLEVMTLENDRYYGTDDHHVKGDYYSSVHIYQGDVGSVDVKMKQTAITQKSTATVNGASGVRPQAVVPITPSDYKNGKPYVDVNTFIESDETYTFVFNLLTGGEKPELFVSDSENFQPFDVQYNYETGLATAQHELDKGNSMMKPTKSGNTSLYARRPHLIDYDPLNEYGYEKDIQETSIHLGTSFVFTKGVGNHYMFGREIHMDAGETLQFYPDIDWSEYSSDGNNKTSFYLPFMSEEKLGTIGTDSSDISIGVKNHEAGDAASDTYYWSYPDWNWQNFILFTSPNKWENKGETGADSISIYFNESATLTIPFTAKNLEYDYYDNSSVEYGTKDLQRWSNSSMMKGNKMSRYVSWKSGSDYSEEIPYEDKEFFYYTPYIKAELTEDVWAQVDTDGKGRESYSHAFKPTAYYSNMEFELVDKSDGSSEKKDVNLLERCYDWGSQGLKKVGGAIKSGVTSLAEGAKKFAGWLYDGLKWIWNGIQKLFGIIYNAIIDFVGWITNILEDIAQVLGTLAKRIAYISGMLGFVAIMAGTSKVIKLTEWSG